MDKTMITICCLALATIADAQEVYKEESSRQRDTEYVIADSWHAKCSLYTDMRIGWRRSCELQATTGKKERSGTYETISSSLSIDISMEQGDAVRLRIETGYRVMRGKFASLKIAGKNYGTIQNKAEYAAAVWDAHKAADIIPLLKKHNSYTYFYVLPTGGVEQGEVRLKGFTKIWDYATDFVGADPIAAK